MIFRLKECEKQSLHSHGERRTRPVSMKYERSILCLSHWYLQSLTMTLIFISPLTHRCTSWYVGQMSQRAERKLPHWHQLRQWLTGTLSLSFCRSLYLLIVVGCRYPVTRLPRGDEGEARCKWQCMSSEQGLTISSELTPRCSSESRRECKTISSLMTEWNYNLIVIICLFAVQGKHLKH